MSERVLKRAVIILLVLGLAAVAAAISLRNLDFFDITSVTFVGVDTAPESAVSLMRTAVGRNRFALDEDYYEKTLEENPLIADAEIRYEFPAAMKVTLTRSGETVLLSDGSSYYLLDSEGRPREVAAEDCAAYAGELCVVEISASYLDYLRANGPGPGFEAALDLIAQSARENGSLISWMKYDNNSGDGFGQIVLGLDSLGSELHVRERVSAKRLGDSLRVIMADVGGDPAGLVSIAPTRWDLYSGALVKRMVREDG